MALNLFLTNHVELNKFPVVITVSFFIVLLCVAFTYHNYWFEYDDCVPVDLEYTFEGETYYYTPNPSWTDSFYFWGFYPGTCDEFILTFD